MIVVVILSYDIILPQFTEIRLSCLKELHTIFNGKHKTLI